MTTIIRMKPYLRKVAIIGTTGSGKTTFLQALAGPFRGAEVKRRVETEKLWEYMFTPVRNRHFFKSTTTMSMNVESINFVVTSANCFKFYSAKQKTYPVEEIDQLFPTVLVDTAGQDRLMFIPQIAVKGAHGVIIIADGTNISSIERVSDYIKLAKNQEEIAGMEIPIIVFINKKDLEEEGVYVGKRAVDNWLLDSKISVHESTVHDLDTFLVPLRNFLNKINGFPVPKEKYFGMNTQGTTAKK
ncbi:MAG: GTPase domain-containing protein [Candidatus Odinarchaeota archaeon]